MNLVGHVAVALRPGSTRPSTDFLVGCMLPDLAAIARRAHGQARRATSGGGVAFHHACDAVFHESEWFRATNRDVRDALLDAGVDLGPARACSHAGVEMLLDGALVAERTDRAFARAGRSLPSTPTPRCWHRSRPPTSASRGSSVCS